MNPLMGKKILFITAKFFNYEKEIQYELERQGAIVTMFDERPANNFLTKVLIRLDAKQFIKSKIDEYYDSIIEKISEVKYDYIFLISPEVIDEKILKKIKSTQLDSKVYVYMWDSIQNIKQALQLLPYVNRFYTFDSTDKLIDEKIKFLPLFYVEDYQKISKKMKPKYDVSFIGTVHSDRYKIVKEIEKIAKIDGLSTYSYFYSPSKILFFFKRIFNKHFRDIDLNDISFTALNKNEILEIIENSNIIIDIEHPKQKGLTMRTIEMLGAKRKLITTNKNIEKYDFFKEKNILVIDRENITFNIDFFLSPYEELEKEIYIGYSLNNWIKEIFH